MSGRGRLAVCAAAASLLTACSLLPLATPTTWFVQAALLVMAQSAVGAATRRVPLARAVTVAAQASVSLMLMTFVFVPGRALLGLIPGPQAIGGLGRLLAQGVQDVGQFATPAPVTAGIRLLLVGGVVVIALAVDTLAVTFRSAAPAGLPLLALYSVASGLGEGGGRWLWFLFAATGYLLLLLAEGRDRLSRWGRVFTSTSRRPPYPAGPGAAPGAAAPARAGRRIGALALGIALVAPAVLPAMGEGLIDPAERGAGRGPMGGTIAAVNPLVSLQSSLNQTQDREVLRYRTTSDDSADMYLRIITLDQFDGTSWRASERRVTDVPPTLPTPAGLSSSVQVTEVDTSIAAAPGYVQNYLPMPYPATRVRVRGDWRYEPEGRTLVGDRGQTTSGAQYQVASLQVQPTARQLADAPPAAPRVRQEYTRLPASLPPEVRQTALRVTQGAANDYERAVRIQDWFATSGGFIYDTRVAEGSGSDAIVRFLHDKRGFCVHFAFSMAAMARTLGIPARVDVGFVPGTLQSDNSWSIGLKDAHAWPELYFEGIGWTRFEPTPSRGSTPDYARPSSPAAGAPDPSSPHHGSGASPAPGPSASSSCPPAARRTGDCGTGGQLPAGGGASGGGPGTAGLLGVLGGAALLLVAVAAALPALWRSRVRTARLASAADSGLDPRERTLDVWRELVDTAWDYGLRPDSAGTPRATAARLVHAFGLDTSTAEAVRRVGGAVEQVLYAPAARDVPGLDEDVRKVRRALHTGADRLTRLRAVLAPRSAARLAWRLSERWTATAHRCRDALRRTVTTLRARGIPRQGTGS